MGKCAFQEKSLGFDRKRVPAARGGVYQGPRAGVVPSVAGRKVSVVPAVRWSKTVGLGEEWAVGPLFQCLCARYGKYTQKATAGSRKTRQEVRDAGPEQVFPVLVYDR